MENGMVCMLKCLNIQQILLAAFTNLAKGLLLELVLDIKSGNICNFVSESTESSSIYNRTPTFIVLENVNTK
jgi:hypothetical protein